MLFTRAPSRLPEMEVTVIFSLAEQTGTEEEQTRRFILIFPAGRVSIERSLENMNRKAAFPGRNISVFPAGGTAVPIITSALWKRRTDASPTEEFGMRTGNGFWES